MPDEEARLHGLAAKQHGVVSREQVLDSGISEYVLRSRVSAGRWKKLFPFTYVIGGVPWSWNQSATSALLWAGPDSALSHRSAAFVQGWVEKAPATLELTIPPSRTLSARGVKIHRSDLTAFNEVKVVNGMRITDAPRTLIDLAGEEDLDELLELALHYRPYIRQWTQRRLKQIGRTTSKGIARLRAAFLRYPAGDIRTDSLLETKFRNLIFKNGLAAAHHYVLLGKEGEWIIESDFAWPREKVIAQCDGRKWHDNPRAFDERATIQAKAAAMGWRLIPVTWNRVKHQPEKLIRDLKDAIAYGEGIARLTEKKRERSG